MVVRFVSPFTEMVLKMMSSWLESLLPVHCQQWRNNNAGYSFCLPRSLLYKQRVIISQN
jgi:hypothetical protein